MYSYFLAATDNEIVRMKNLDDACRHIEQTEPLVGGKIPFQAIVSLSKIFQTNPLKSIEHKITEEAKFYLFGDELTETLANANSEELMDLSVLWDEDYWTETEINRMDLAGFLFGLSLLCKQARKTQKNLYLLESDED